MSVSTVVNPSKLTQNLLDYIRNISHVRFPERDRDLIERSCSFAEKHYAGATHPTNKSYTEYALHVAQFLIELEADANLVSAAVLCLSPSITQQIVEDLRHTFEDEPEIPGLVTEFMRFGHLEWNTWLRYLDDNQSVIRQTTLKKMYLLALGEAGSSQGGGENLFQKKEKQVENIIRMFLATTDIRVLIIKLVDRLYFMRFLKDLPASEKDAIQAPLLARITLAVYAPLAERLGLWQLKSELEDMSFRLLDFDKYKEIAGQLALKKKERNESISQIIQMIKALLDEYGVDAEVIGRAKHLYSIHKKMEAKKLELGQINDLFAIRIIVDDQEEEQDKQEAKEAQAIRDCKEIQDILYEKWPPATSFYDGEVGKNWIDSPKVNGYQSLHTTVIIDGKFVEVQIRTRRMNDVAEYGSAAAHWRYKEERAYRRGRIPGPPGKKDRIWHEKLIKVRKNLVDSADDTGRRFSSFERSLAQDWVYAITPRGHVVDLATGATPLDFAYRIHTNLGHRYNGAKVNGRPAPMHRMLNNGDIVEIAISSVRNGPSPNWLSRRSIEEEQKDADFDSLRSEFIATLPSANLEKLPHPQWLHVSEKKKDRKNGENQGEIYLMYYMFARTRQARTKIQNWLNKQKTDKRSLKFEWYQWVSWDDIKQSAGSKRHPIPKEAGVYEVRHVDRKLDERLLIGRAENLEARIREELVKGDKTTYPNRQQLLAEAGGDTSKLVVRWATTDFSPELETSLLNKYKRRFRSLPKYVDKA